MSGTAQLVRMPTVASHVKFAKCTWLINLDQFNIFLKSIQKRFQINLDWPEAISVSAGTSTSVLLFFFLKKPFFCANDFGLCFIGLVALSRVVCWPPKKLLVCVCVCVCLRGFFLKNGCFLFLRTIVPLFIVVRLDPVSRNLSFSRLSFFYLCK